MSAHQHHSHQHQHHNHHHVSELENDAIFKNTHTRLVAAAILNLVITLAQVIGGIMSNSLSLLSDALHNFSDGMALFLAWAAQSISRKKSSSSKTYGYKRIEIISAFINSFILIFISLYIFTEAYHRYFNPEPIKAGIMLSVAVIGLLANVFSVFLLHSVSEGSLNIKAAYLHLLGDTLSSVAVILGAVAIHFWNVVWIDPLVSVIVGVYVIILAWPVLRKSMHVLMQGSPDTVDIAELEEHICAIAEVKGIHHLHVWNLDENTVLMEAHITLHNDLNVSETQALHSEINKMLDEHFDIKHTTLQFEFADCQFKEC